MKMAIFTDLLTFYDEKHVFIAIYTNGTKYVTEESGI